ncbi:MAG TPA: UTP--glucose-1-phosphate uridylyltransferase [Solirubrobacteraceae bacterium]|jgi:UTP--glucose-1-phosphate uridylyltransferase|nr:UTP--glucose-1-phosphate uridylyltransferase [Solirubrobacteraceae bacterium]
MSADGLTAAEEKMRAAGQPEGAIRAFRSAYERLVGGESGMLPSDDLEPAGEVPALADLPDVDAAAALEHVAVIKLNGGLATSMGLRSPKSLLEAREGRTFLDIITGQTLALRRRFGVELPLILMDSEATREETLKALAARTEVSDEFPLDFLQSMIPKLDADSLAPVSWPGAPALEWCPPGHGDIYSSLAASGMLAALRERGLRYAMISNADNLGATLDPRIAAHVAAEGVPFLMEVVEGTEADRKGGHIARRRADGRLLLRETAQTPSEDLDSFRDYRRWRYYNTNNLWLDLEALAAALEGNDGVLELPLIINRKTVDPRDTDSTPVLQLESAMGAAIGSFSGAALLLVPRTRFVPVKTTDDLLVLRSDVYTLSADFLVEPRRERAENLPLVELDSKFYKLLDDFEARFPAGPPSLAEAERLVVHGDVTFGPGVVVRGAVEVEAEKPAKLEATALTGTVRLG